jgi:uncharacterized repeat protein (TIGR04076 family)
VPRCKITVLKTLYHQELAEAYRRPDIHRGPCPFFDEGQEFVVDRFGERPAGFDCTWAWDDIHKIVFAMVQGGEFGRWMQDPNTFISCCTDGIKPVIFKLEKLEG